MKNWWFIIVCMLFNSYLAFAQSSQDISVRIAKYKGDKNCAISYTFDDGLKEHYTLVAPKFEELGFRGTFWINGIKINENENAPADTTRMTWGQLKEMAGNGHEVSNHGWAHKNFGRHTLDEIKEDIYKNDSAIFSNIGIMPRTFCYPHNTKTPEGMKIASENRVGTRTKQRSIGSKSTPEDLEKWVNTLIETNDWGVGMTHGITYGYDAFVNPQRFWNHLDKVKAMEDKIWVDTFEKIVSYIEERDNTELKVTKKKNDIIIVPKLSLNKDLFVQPLTMVIDKKGIKKATAKQGKKKLEVQIHPDKVLFDFDPFDGTVQLNLK
ncbi:polysaccharide deacetylase family protein [Dysgonomonas sp. 216]|uniref:polysaccharide deacetylase family protein n=1 Tax=Dysgonomonas sp. 216 TaxID=2302934 RepID=UPI0013D308A3|nr:polysaccharide deacetylase family protein [Dysgonomonas sp. 216]NDW19174.1 polysaccharide deacetylase family protein [Dysgonomonas sp. 216]